jgi:mRNA interferase MazF
MNRGEIWTVAGGPEYAGKPRPAVIVQDDVFDATRSVTVCPITSQTVDVPSIRPVVDPSTDNGLRVASRLMVDKVTTVSRAKLHQRVGRLSPEDAGAMNRAISVFLGLGSSPRSG